MAAFALGTVVACRVPPVGRSATVRAVVARTQDTTRFQLPARANRCAGAGGGLLVQGSRDGNGAAAWLRTPGSVGSGVWPLLQRGDTLSQRGAVVGVRFMVGDQAHGAVLDSGSVTVTRGDGAVTIAVRGTGFETAAGGRVGLEVTFDAVPVASDTVPCRR